MLICFSSSCSYSLSDGFPFCVTSFGLCLLFLLLFLLLRLLLFHAIFFSLIFSESSESASRLSHLFVLCKRVLML